jgi:hypothetical protein
MQLLSSGGKNRGEMRSSGLQRLPWVAATLLLMTTTSSVAAFSSMVKPSSVVVGGIQSAKPTFQLHSPTRLQVSTEAEVGIADFESLRGNDGIYELADGEMHK